MNQYEITSIVLSGLSFVVIVVSLVQIYFRDRAISVNNVSAKRIANVHVVCGLLHISSALALGWVAAWEKIVWEAPVYSTHAIWQNTTQESCASAGRCYIKPKIYLVDDIPVAIFAVLFGIISGYAHLISVAVLGKDTVREYAENGSSPVRWIDYFFSASLMVFTIGCLSSVLDIFVLSTTSLFQGYLLYNAYFIEKKLATAFIKGTKTRGNGMTDLVVASLFYLVGVWLPIVYSFYASVADTPADPPEWINALIWILFSVFSSFLGIMVYFLVIVPRTSNLSMLSKQRYMVQQELAYSCLSVVAKVALHWILFVGVTSRSGVLFNDLETAQNDADYHRTGEDNMKTTQNVLAAGLGTIGAGIVFYIISRYYVLREYRASPEIAMRLLEQ